MAHKPKKKNIRMMLRPVKYDLGLKSLECTGFRVSAGKYT